jgi:hypothetical protein
MFRGFCGDSSRVHITDEEGEGGEDGNTGQRDRERGDLEMGINGKKVKERDKDKDKDKERDRDKERDKEKERDKKKSRDGFHNIGSSSSHYQQQQQPDSLLSTATKTSTTHSPLSSTSSVTVTPLIIGGSSSSPSITDLSLDPNDPEMQQIYSILKKSSDKKDNKHVNARSSFSLMQTMSSISGKVSSKKGIGGKKQVRIDDPLGDIDPYHHQRKKRPVRRQKHRYLYQDHNESEDDSESDEDRGSRSRERDRERERERDRERESGDRKETSPTTTAAGIVITPSTSGSNASSTRNSLVVVQQPQTNTPPHIQNQTHIQNLQTQIQVETPMSPGVQGNLQYLLDHGLSPIPV